MVDLAKIHAIMLPAEYPLTTRLAKYKRVMNWRDAIFQSLAWELQREAPDPSAPLLYQYEVVDVGTFFGCCERLDLAKHWALMPARSAAVENEDVGTSVMATSAGVILLSEVEFLANYGSETVLPDSPVNRVIPVHGNKPRTDDPFSNRKPDRGFTRTKAQAAWGDRLGSERDTTPSHSGDAAGGSRIPTSPVETSDIFTEDGI